MYVENEPAIGRNEAISNNLPGEHYTIEADNKMPDNCKYPLEMILAAQNQKQINLRGLVKLLKLKIGATVMLTVNVDMQDCIVHGLTGNVKHIEFVQSSIHKVHLKFSDEQAGSRAMRSSFLVRQNCWLALAKCETEIPIKKGLESLNKYV